MAITPGLRAEYRKRLSNPGQRSTIPDAYLKALSPTLFATRQANAANVKRTATNNKLYDPSRMLSGSEVYSLAKAQASNAFDPAIASATQDRRLAIANDAALAERVSGYSQMQNKALADAHEAAQTGQTALASQLASTRTNTLGALDASQAKDQQFLQDDAALRGGDVTQGMAQRLASDFAQQRQGVATTLAAQENAGNTNAQSWTGLVGMMQAAQAIRGNDTQTQIGVANANREASLSQGITDLQQKKGAAQTDAVNTLRQSEFEKGAAIQTLGIKQQAANTTAAKAAFDAKYKTAKLKADQEYRSAEHDLKVLTQQQAHGDRSAALQARIKEANARIKTAASNLTLSQQRLDLARRKEDVAEGKIPTAKDTTGKWLPPVAQAHAISDFHRLQSDPTLRKFKQDGKTRQEAADAISSSDKWGKLDPALISAALDMAYVGHLSPGTAAKLHRAKVKVSGLGVPVRHPGKTMSISGIPPLTKKPQG